MARAVVHLGTHKTGTKSFQQYLSAHRDAIRAATGLRPYEGRFGVHPFELALLALRANRSMPKRVEVPDWCLPSFQAEVREQIARQSEGDDDLLISSEALSYLRHPDEVDVLRDLLAPRDLEFVVVLRDRTSFLTSYRAQMKESGFAPSPYPESFAYVEDDSWLVDYDALLATYEGVRVVDYPTSESVIPAIFEAIGIERQRLPDWSDYWVHRTGAKRPLRIRVGWAYDRALRRHGVR